MEPAPTNTDAASGSILPARVTTPRLTLRSWRVDDAAAMARAVAESIDHLRPWMPWIAFEPLTLDARRDLITEWERTRLAGGDAIYGVFLDGVPVGGTGLHRRIGPGGLEIGYWIHPAFTRRGFATEVSDSLTDVGFTVDHIERVEIRHDRTNVASGNVPPRLGYEFVEERARPIEAPAETGIDCVWAMTKDRWTHQRALRTGAVEH